MATIFFSESEGIELIIALRDVSGTEFRIVLAAKNLTPNPLSLEGRGTIAQEGEVTH